MPARNDRPLLYTVTRRWLDVVGTHGSLFEPHEAVWTPDAIEALVTRIADDPQSNGKDFQPKLLPQARAEGRAGQRLAAEAMFVFQLRDASGNETDKRASVDNLLAGLTPAVSVPADLDAVYGLGLVKYGINRIRGYYDYLFLLRFAGTWAALDGPERDRLLGDGWGFRSLLDTLDNYNATFSRDCLKHLVHPDTFEAVASQDAKRKILKALGGVKVGSTTDLDKELSLLRATMESEGRAPEGFSFYDPDVRPLWAPTPVAGTTVEDDPAEDDPDGDATVGASRALRLTALAEAVEAKGLLLAPRVLAGLLAALNSGKHVILTGAPGTAKTTLAELVARLAATAGRCNGHVLATATADWSTYETVGGLRPLPDGTLEFAPGVVLEAIDADRWLVLDEMNRANTDRALGPLFTVLSGQAVVLPSEQDGRPVRIRPASVPADPAFRDYVVEPGWRIIATTNVLDRALLFDLSFALMRRFAFVDVGAPDLDGYRQLVRDAVADGPLAVRDRAEDLVGRLLPLTALRPLGPALFIDAAKYVAAYVTDRPAAPDGEVVADTFMAFLLPQFEGADEQQARALLTTVVKAAGPGQRTALTTTLRLTLGAALTAANGLLPDEDDSHNDDEADAPGGDDAEGS